MSKRTANFTFELTGSIKKEISIMVRVLTSLSAAALFFFIILGLAGLVQNKVPQSPLFSMNGLASSLPTDFFLDMMGMEVPHFNKAERLSAFSQKNVSTFIFKLLTDVNPDDPQSLMAREVPGMNKEQMIVLDKTEATQDTVFPSDFTPSIAVLDPNPTAAPSQAPHPPVDLPAIPKGVTPDKDKPALTTKGQKVIFIYHSHNRESWLPELKSTDVKELKDAFDPKINITLLGKRLAEKLEELGVGATSSSKDYPTSINKFNYNFSYKYSLKTVQEAFAANSKLEYFFDIHRDSQKRDLTTVRINGQDYAQIFLIVGLRNKNWEKNKAFADKINEKLDEKYPGISRGTYNKPSNSGNAEYNQSFSPNSILIEVGGPENNLAESYRTIDVLAGIVAEIYWDAEKVSAPALISKAK